MSDDAPNPNSLTIALNSDGTVSIVYPENELMARFLVNKAQSLIDMEFHRRNAMAQVQANQPRVIPANGGGPLESAEIKRGRG